MFFFFIGCPPSEICDKASCLCDVFMMLAFSVVLCQLVPVVASDLLHAGTKRPAVAMLMVGCAFMVGMVDFAGFVISKILACNVPAVAGVF